MKMTSEKSSFSSKRLLHHTSLFSLLASRTAWQYLTVVKVHPSSYPVYPGDSSGAVLDIFCMKSLLEDVLQSRSIQLVIRCHRVINTLVMGFWDFPWWTTPRAVTYTACCTPSSDGVLHRLMRGDDPSQSQFSLYIRHFSSTSLGP